MDGKYDLINKNMQTNKQCNLWNQITDDVEFIVRLQDECGIANETPKETAEWFYALSICRTLENHKQMKTHYDKYTSNPNQWDAKTYYQVLCAKNIICESFYNDIYNLTYSQAYYNFKHAKMNYSTINDLHWDLGSQGELCSPGR